MAFGYGVEVHGDDLDEIEILHLGLPLRMHSFNTVGEVGNETGCTRPHPNPSLTHNPLPCP